MGTCEIGQPGLLPSPKSFTSVTNTKNVLPQQFSLFQKWIPCFFIYFFAQIFTTSGGYWWNTQKSRKWTCHNANGVLSLLIPQMMTALAIETFEKRGWYPSVALTRINIFGRTWNWPHFHWLFQTNSLMRLIDDILKTIFALLKHPDSSTRPSFS